MSTSGNNDDWNWEQNDKEFYQNFLKLPQASDRKYYKAMKEQRMKNIGVDNRRIDLRPKVAWKVMKVEIIIFATGIIFAIALPFYSKYLNIKIREPDEINIENIKNRVISHPLEHEKKKERIRLENRLKNDYVRDYTSEKIKEEIEKTYKDIYDDEYRHKKF